VLLGLAAAIKGPPLIFAAYLIWRCRWSAAAVMLIVAVGVGFIPDLIGSPPDGGTWLQYSWTRIVVPSQQLTMPAGTWFSAVIYNQSLNAAMQRWFGATVEPRTLKLATYSIMLLMLAVSLAASMRGQGIGPRSPMDAPLPSQTALELAATMLLALIFSPMTGLAHYGVLILPAFCLARLALIGNRRWALATVLAVLAIALAAGKDLVGSTAYTAAMWAGAPFIGLVILWLGCIVATACGQGLAVLPSLSRSLLPWWPRRQPG